mgnify:CR=1 FL=1
MSKESAKGETVGRTKCANRLLRTRGFASVLVAIVALALMVMEADAEEATVVSVTNPTIDNFSNGGGVGLYFSAKTLCVFFSIISRGCAT